MLQFSLALVALVTIVRLGSSLYLPALTHIQADLHLTDQAAASTMTVYFACFSAFALLAGPVSDARGRRTLVFGGLGLFALGTVLCGVAQGLTLLLAGRALQALGGSAIPVVTRAMVRDHCDDEQLVEVMGWMGVFNSLAPILAPVLGGVITQFAGWRADFQVLLAATVVLTAWSWGKVPETLPPEKRTPLHLGFTLRQFRRMLTSGLFMGVLMPVLFCFALQGAYLALGPFTFLRVLGLSPLEFGFTSLPLVLALVLGRSLCMRLLKRFDGPTSFVISGGVILVSAILAAGVALAHERTLLALYVPTLVFCLGFGSLLPLGLKSVMTAFQDVGGTASALHTSLMLGASAVGSALGGMALHHVDEYLVLILATAATGPLVFLSCYLSRKLVC